MELDFSIYFCCGCHVIYPFCSLDCRFFSVYINLSDILEKLPFLPIPIFGMGEAFYSLQLSIGISWFLLLAVIGLPWLRRHFKEFRR
ncbi:MAG: hypothetical protein LBQ50_09835 [Planctomycetaceae bacterium]|jgi:hypothetical protein|nr:hypothetical protein [Planctomycetaceae bacterium]